MKKDYYVPIIFIVVSIIIVYIFATLGPATKDSDKYNGFAQCINDSGAKFYGAFWCPHCNSQKVMFEGADDLLPYIECSTPDRSGQLAVCSEIGIETYPTWIFSDGNRQTGSLSLEVLAEKTGCILPK